MLNKNIVVIDPERCKSCGLCVHVCPKKILAIGETANSKGYYIVELTDQAKCIGCAFCALMCPDASIEVYREERE